MTSNAIGAASNTSDKSPLDHLFVRVRAEGRPAFIPYLTAGYPTREETVMLAETFAARGADAIELGIPFSDPLGDGPTIQRSSAVALEKGMSVRGALAVAAEIRRRVEVPLVAMGYINPLLRYGLEAFCRDAAASGIQALIVPDLPPEESTRLREHLQEHGLHLIHLLAPTSTDERIKAVAARASGFIYCMAVTGVTGARDALSTSLPAFLARVRAETALPLVVGFGISRPDHVVGLRGVADGVVVASALVDLIDATAPARRDAVIGDYIEGMRGACSVS